MSLESELDIPQKTKRKNAKLNGLDNLKPISKGSRTREQIIATASKGGQAKAKKEKRRKELREAMDQVLNLPATGKVKDLLQLFGYEGEDLTNASAVAATLFVMGVNGNLDALKLILEYGFKVSDDDRKNKESEARISAMAKNGVDISVDSRDGDDGGVVIYLPEIEKEENAEASEEE